MNTREGKAGSHRDPIEFTTGSLGAAKTAAAEIGKRLVVEFEHVDDLIAKAEDQGVIVKGIVFKGQPVVQAAWQAHRGHDHGPPMMKTEDVIVLDTQAVKT
jgi:hypothetical protein